MLYVKLCGQCSRTIAAGSPGQAGALFLCQGCKPKVMSGFDPQPGDVVRRDDGLYTARLVIISREGDTVVTQLLGYPGECTAYPVRELRP